MLIFPTLTYFSISFHFAEHLILSGVIYLVFNFEINLERPKVLNLPMNSY